MIVFKIIAAIIATALIMILFMGITAAFMDEATEHSKNLDIAFVVIVIAIWILATITFAALII